MMDKPETESQGFEAQAALFKLLTHPARLAILNILRDGEQCVCHMEAYLGYRQSYISQQLAVLREAGLIQDRRDGWNIYYRVINAGIYEIMDAVQKMTGQPAVMAPLIGVVCPCPHCQENGSPGIVSCDPIHLSTKE